MTRTHDSHDSRDMRDAHDMHDRVGHVFLRHPPVPQARGLCYGRTDYALPAAVFAAAAADLRARHPELSTLPILCSPARRCRDLALALALDADERSVRSDPGLIEMDFGDWEGRPWSRIARDDLDRWSADIAGFRPPQGECFGDLIARVGVALSTLRTPHLIVAHAGTIRAAHHLFAGLPVAAAAMVEVPFLQPIGLGAAAAPARIVTR